MTDIRCPMCSKTNPAEAELCRYCGARLIPVAPTHAESAPGDQISQSAPDDWLGSLRSGASPIEPGGEESGEEAESSRSPEEITNWMNRIQPSAPPSSAPEPAEAALSDLSDHFPTSEDAPAEPDWLSGLVESTPVEPSSAENLPEWLTGLAPSDLQPPATSEDSTAALEWLSSLGPIEYIEPETEQAAQVPLPVEQEAPAAPPADITREDVSSAADWLASLRVEEEQPAEQVPPAEGLPAWLDEFGQQDSQTGETPSWGETTSAQEEAGAPAEAAAVPAGELPDWLQAIPRPGEGEGGDIKDEKDLSWLSQFAEEVESAPRAVSEPRGEGEAFLPAFFSEVEEPAAPSQPGLELPSMPETAETEEAAAALLQPTPGEPELPDWLADFNKTAVEPGEPEVKQAELAEPQRGGQEIPTLPGGEIQPGGDMPDWLRKVKSSAQEEMPLLSVPPLLSAEAAPEEAQPAAETVSSLEGQLPDWLAHPERIQGEGQAVEAGAGELAPAELPGWVEAMRPVQVGVPGGVPAEELDNRVEKAGPLAGLQGVVPIQGVPAVARKSSSYIGELRVSERQRQNAVLLQEVLSEETRPFPVLIRRGDAPRMMFRLLVGLILILSFVLWSVSGFEFTPPPAASPQTQGLFQKLERLTPGSAVLLAVEYEASLAGEMRWVSSSVVRHLMEKNVRLASLSTLPEGSALAADLLQQVQRGINYSLTDQYANLGYLAGGTTSLAELANSPLPKAFPTTLDGKPFQAQKALQGITNLRDFAAVVILTDSPESARAWVEQVRTPLHQSAGGLQVPFYIVSSAQAAPLVLPYLEGGQVQGLVAGLAGGAAYESVSQRPGGANLFWGAYQLGIIFSILILVAGGLIQFAADLSRRAGKRG